MPESETRVIVLARVVGFHCWRGAPEVVGHLAARHRHTFTLRVEWAVAHDDRDVEFQLAQRDVLRAVEYRWGCGQLGVEFGGSSCETIAKDLATQLVKMRYAHPAAVEVWEDDECGARVTFGGRPDEHASSPDASGP